MLRRGGSNGPKAKDPKLTGLYRQTNGEDVDTIRDGIGSAELGTRILAHVFN